MRKQSYSTRTFRFRQQLGVGGFGEVYLAELQTSEGFSKVVAVKLLRPEAARNTELINRLRDEARLLGQLRHPAIVQADDLVLLKGRMAMVLEYVPGANLNWLMHPQAWPEPIPGSVVLAVVRRVAEALDAAWNRPSMLTGEPLRLIHRDIKPSNIRITPDGEVKVLDFGIALSDDPDRASKTMGKRLGSLPYMAPETLLSLSPTPATDVYSLGITCYEMIARAHFGRCELQELAHQELVHNRLRILDMRAFGGVAPEALELIDRMLSFQPDARPEAAEIAHRIRTLQHRLAHPPLEEWATRAVPHVSDACAPKDQGAMTGAQVLVDDLMTNSLNSQDLSERTGSIMNPGSVIGTSYWGGNDSAEQPVVPGQPESAPAAAPDNTAAGGWGLFVATGGILVLAFMAWLIWPQDERIDYTPPAEVLRSNAGLSAPVQQDANEALAEPADTPEPVEAPAQRDEPALPPIPAGRTTSSEFTVQVISTAPAQIETVFNSRPLGLGVQVDGVFRGRTPLRLELSAGQHAITFGDGDQYYEASVQVTEGGPNTWSYDLEDGVLR